MTTPTLLPCPFCGSTDDDNDLRRVIDGEWENAWIECDKCGAQGPHVAMQPLPLDLSTEDFIKVKNLTDAEASAAAATAWNQRSAWQPIETAPRDGRDFIAYNEFTGPYITAAKAMPPDDEIRYPMYCWRGVKGSWFPEPTHWQPQPSPPPITP